MAVVIGGKEAFEKITSTQGKTVIVDFYAEWCGPCKMLSPILEEIENENSDVLIAKVNIDDHMDIAADFQVSAVPTVLIYRDDQEIGSFVGFHMKDDILKMIGK